MILVSLPDFGNETGWLRAFQDEAEQLTPIHVAGANLQAFAIYPLGIRQVHVRRVRQHGTQKADKRLPAVIAGQLGVRNIQTNAHALLAAERRDGIGIDEQVVELLSPKVPGKGGHGLGNDFHALRVELRQAVRQPLV